MSPTSLGGGKQTTTAGEHISQLVATRSKNLNNGVIILDLNGWDVLDLVMEK